MEISALNPDPILRRTKIVVTVGPSIESPEMLRILIELGVSIFRINFSHGSPQAHSVTIQTIRSIANSLSIPVAILGDLQGPKIRIASFQSGSVKLKVGQRFQLDSTLPDGEGTEKAVGLEYRSLAQEVSSGDVLLLKDGAIRLKVIDSVGSVITTEVLSGGYLTNRQGVNKLGGGLAAPAVTKKDLRDIQLAANLEVDYLGLSFVRSQEDIELVRAEMVKLGWNGKVIAKIERAEAVAETETLNGILKASDGVMVARGDLGIEIGDAALPGVQKKVIQAANQMGLPVITATQMLESMIHMPVPTRAEVLDIANAVLDGSDALMLSAETAIGEYPIEAVKAMHGICVGAEAMLEGNGEGMVLQPPEANAIEVGISRCVNLLAAHLPNISAVVSLTASGKTPLLISRYYCRAPIFAISPSESVLRACALYRGVTPVKLPQAATHLPQSISSLVALVESRYLRAEDYVIMTQGMGLWQSGSSNSCCVLQVPSPLTSDTSTSC